MVGAVARLCESIKQMSGPAIWGTDMRAGVAECESSFEATTSVHISHIVAHDSSARIVSHSCRLEIIS
jgi:hypothetical protein